MKKVTKKEISMHQTINISKVSLQKLLQMNLILGWFYLDKPRAEIIRMVLRATEPHWNGAVWRDQNHGEDDRDAHVHDCGPG